MTTFRLLRTPSTLARLFVLALSCLCGFAAFAAEPARNLAVEKSALAERRVALVIGNAAYPGAGALKNPANDARDIAARLKKLGFEVIVRTDARQKDMLRSLTEFGEKVQAGTEALFFYAGHGMQVRGKNYLIPIDAEIRSESAVSSEAVDVDQLLDKLSPARLSLVILDACRNNPFERRFRGGGQGLAQINAPTGTLIAYATAPGKVAADGEGRNGLYTAELLAAMDVPGIRIEDVFKRVRANVVRKSGEAQTPWESSSLTGDFYFRPGSGSPLAQPEKETPPIHVRSDAEIEQELWDSIKESRTNEVFEEYLRQYPQGRYQAQARIKLAGLRAEASTLAAAPPGPPKLALLIGNASYASLPRIGSTLNDLALMEGALRELSFATTTLTNLDQASLRNELTRFRDRIARERPDAVVFYYAGHGAMFDGDDWILPVDFNPAAPENVRTGAVSLYSIWQDLKLGTLPTPAIFLFDSSRHDPARPQGQPGPTRNYALPNAVFAFAAKPGQHAAEGADGNGVMTGALARNLRRKGATLDAILKATSGDMARLVKAPAAQELDVAGDLDKLGAMRLASVTASGTKEAESPPRSSLATDIAGIWHWSVKSFLVPDRTNTVNADGTCLLNTGTTCIWTWEDDGKRKIAFRFSDTWTHKMTLSEDGRTMTGKDDWGTAVTAKRAGGK